ncbi:MAG: hypothetical protein WEB60_11055 [Terrimicrobiaceae bacterium]
MKIVILLLVFATTLLASESSLQDALTAYRAGDLTAAKVLFESVLVTDSKNVTARNHLRLINQKLARSATLKKTLEGIILSKLTLNDVSAREAFDYTSQLINKEGPEGFRLNLVWIVPADHPAKINLSLEGIPASTALEYLAATAGLNLEFDEFAIKVSAPAAPTAP